jgi:hypothetical protein
MVASVLKLGRSATVVPSLAPVDADEAATLKPASALANLAKRSISASGLSRRSTAASDAVVMTERTRSLAPADRSTSGVPLVAPAASKTLMASLLGGHARSTSPAPPGPPSPALPATANVPSQVEASYISKVAVKLHEVRKLACFATSLSNW